MKVIFETAICQWFNNFDAGETGNCNIVLEVKHSTHKIAIC